MIGHALVGLLLLSGDLRVVAEGTSETRAGEMPIVAGNQPQAFVAEILTPLVGLVYRGPGASFEAAYAPRVFWSDPNALGSWEPLVLHTVSLLFDDQVTPRFRLGTAATGSIGQTDYTALPQLLGTTQQGALPPVQTLVSAMGRVTGRGDLSERWKLELDGQAFYWRWLEIPPVCPTTTPAPGTGCITPQTITSQVSGTETATVLFRLNPRHELGFGAAFAQAHYSDGIDILTLGPTATWVVRLTPNDDLRLMLGLVYVHVAGTPPAGVTPLLNGRTQAVAPVGGFEFQSRVVSKDLVLVSTLAKGGVDFYLDPIIGTAVPRALLEAGVVGVLPPNWMATFKGGFATPIRGEPLATTPPPDETTFNVTLAVRRRFSTNFFGEVGVRWADRGPALVNGLDFHQRQLYLYVELIGTTRPLPTAPVTQAPK